jgi:hypothetical protein
MVIVIMLGTGIVLKTTLALNDHVPHTSAVAIALSVVVPHQRA